MIETVHIEGTRKTPTINLNPQGIIRIEGRSIPEDAEVFFKDMVNWVREYILSPPDSTKVDLSFEYLNSGTSKVVLNLLRGLKELEPQGHKLSVNWYYEEGDDDILERGEYFSSVLDLKIRFVEVE